jgi:hypothetical protein
MGITRQLFKREFAAHGRKQRLIEATGESEEAIRDSSLTAQQRRRSRQHRIEPSIHLWRYGWSRRRPDEAAAGTIAYLWMGIEQRAFEGLQK